MNSNTISVSPIPQSTTVEKIKQVFKAFSVKNVHIDGKTAYVEFYDEGDLQTLEIQFDNYEVAELNHAKIDTAEFDWSSVKKEHVTSPSKKSESSEHQDLMAADIDNLIVVQNCDQKLLQSLPVENIKDIFKGFHSVNRIVKRKNDVVVEFTDVGQMEKLENKFNNFNVPQLGNNTRIEKADRSKISPDDFVSQWSKFHTNESMMTQHSTNLGYKDEKPSSGEYFADNKYNLGSTEQKHSHNVLHEDIIPPFDKKTSMEVNFLSEQSQLGYKQDENREAIPQATTHQQLDYTSEVKLPHDQNKLGYSDEQKQESSQEEKQRQENKKRQEEQHRRKEEQDQKKRQQETIRKRREEQELQAKGQEQERQRKRNEQERRKRQEEEKQRKRDQEQRQRRRDEEEKQRKRDEQDKARKLKDEEERSRREQERMTKQLKEKLEFQRGKFDKEGQKHEAPTQSQNVAKQVEAVKQVGQSIQKQLGYAVNKAKQESAHLLQSGLELLKGSDNKSHQTQQQKGQEKGIKKSEIEKLGYEEINPKEIGLNLINSSLSFAKDAYTKFQEHFGQQANRPKQALTSTSASFGQQKSDIGYEKWNVKPDVNVIRPVAGGQSPVLRTLITVTLLIWVIFLLMQDTSEVIPSISEIQIPHPTD